MHEKAGVTARRADLLRHPWVAALVVLSVYGVLALLNSTGGYLGTDTGAKVITLDRMADEDTLSPAVGYWAEEWDPDGDYHPLFDTRQNDDGEWINVTTLPMLVVAQPLYELGGYRLALLLPMLGGVLTAFACREIARQLAGDQAGRWTFWVVGLASPIVIYSLDLWEHALGAALMLGAVAAILRVVFDDDSSPLLALAAGAALGLSATMRAESLVTAFVAVGAGSTVILVRGRFVRSLLTGGGALFGFAAVWLANASFEVQVGGNRRTARVADQADRQWWTEISDRTEEALTTWFAAPGAGYPEAVYAGVVLVACIALGAFLHRRGEHLTSTACFVLAGVMYLVVCSTGLGFVSGALVATPFAVAAVFVKAEPRRIFLLVVAALITVITWTFQLTGGAVPQWAGRYLLVPTLIFATLGVVALSDRDRDRAPRIILTALSVAITLFGVIWLHERSHGVEAFFDELADRPEDVIISTNGFLVREAGPAYQGHRYLSVGRSGTVTGAVDVVRDASFDDFAVLTEKPQPPELDDATYVGTDEVDLLGIPLSYHRFEFTVETTRDGG